MIQFRTSLSQALCCGVGLCLLSVLSGSIVNGQVAVEKMPDDRTGRIYRMKITPAAEPTPIFKHRLCVPPRDTVAMNAATVYLRALGGGTYKRLTDNAYEEHGYEKLAVWQSNDGVPIEGLLDTPARKVSQTFDDFIKAHIEAGTKCRYCDWGMAEEDFAGPELLTLDLGVIQNFRGISRVLALQTRVAIAEKRFDRAVELMRMNYQLGIGVGKMKFLVASLVGLAEVSITNGGMVDMIAAPGSPNMYYALTELPRPTVDLREAWRIEMTTAETLFPELFDAEGSDLTVEAWREKVWRISKSYFDWTVALNNGAPREAPTEIQSEPSIEQLAYHLVPTVASVLAYGSAKQQLIRDGDDPAKVEAMPVAQVVAIAAARSVKSRVNKNERWIYQPVDVAMRGFQQEDQAMQNQAKLLTQPGEIFAYMMLPAGGQVLRAHARIQRDIDAMRVIEAIRMHAAQTGSLPASLDEIKVVPVPVNPATNKPFSYTLKAGTATLDLPKGDGIGQGNKRFELRL